MTTQITKEQLIAHAQAESAALKAMIESGVYSSEVTEFYRRKIELNKIALAAMDAVPVAVINGAREPVLYGEHIGIAIGTHLYAAPPAPVVPDEMEPTVEAIKRVLPTSNPDEYAACIGADMWNACRAAMLQAGNSPVIPDTCFKCVGRGNSHCPQTLGIVECECTFPATSEDEKTD